MKSKLKILVLTDHSNHNAENALYPIIKELNEHIGVDKVFVASRSLKENKFFFKCQEKSLLYGSLISSQFAFNKEDHILDRDYQLLNLEDINAVWLRIPPPLTPELAEHLMSAFESQFIFNNPKGILESGNKSFLLNFDHIVPEMALCQNASDIKNFASQFPIILKPLGGYGGQGIIKIENGFVENVNSNIPLEVFLKSYAESPIDYLAVKYLKNVSNGDKRIIVVDGQVMGASLRLPPRGSWICNVAMGGSSNPSDITEEEFEIVKVINPILKELGILMYGLDTLEDDNGKRILSEINTTSVGGLPQIARMENKPLVEKAIDLIVNRCREAVNK